MAYIKTLKENELIGGQDNNDVYPVTTTQAIYSQNPDGTIPSGIQHQKLEDRLQDNEADARNLHKETEKFVAYLNNDKDGQTLEITENRNYINLSGTAFVECYGDKANHQIVTSNLDSKSLTVKYNNAITNIDGDNSEDPNYKKFYWVGTYTVPNVTGEYITRFSCSYNNTIKIVESSTYVNLRKYFGFASLTPTDVESLSVSHFSNSIECTITLPAESGKDTYKYIYFAVPSEMTITKIIQPDALNAHLPFVAIDQVTRRIGNTEYRYKMYRSTEKINVSKAKRLTIK